MGVFLLRKNHRNTQDCLSSIFFVKFSHIEVPIMPFGYKKVLIIGATSGIGKTVADKVVQNGSNLIVAGRRKENLDEIVQRYGSDKVSATAFDVMQLEKVRSPTPIEIYPHLTSNENKDPAICLNDHLREPRSGLHIRQLGYPTTLRFLQAGNRRSGHLRPRTDHELYIRGPHCQSIPPTPAEPEDRNSHRIHDVANGTRAHDAMSELRRFQGCSAPFHPCPPHSAAGWSWGCEGFGDLSSGCAD